MCWVPDKLVSQNGGHSTESLSHEWKSGSYFDPFCFTLVEKSRLKIFENEIL